MCRLYLAHRHLDKSPMAYAGKETKIVQFTEDYEMIFDRLPLQTRIGDGKCSPICTKHGWFMFVGEIFNYDKNTYKSDVDYLIELFYNESPVTIFNKSKSWDGFWSIVYFDAEFEQLWCWTDPLGKKQLYYRLSPSRELWGNLPEVCSQILPLVNDPTDFDPVFRAEAFKWGYHMGDRTPWNGVRRMIPNKLYWFGSSSEEPNIYPGVDWPEETEKAKAIIEKSPYEESYILEELLIESTRRRLISTGSRVSLLLSGGLDSSLIAVALKLIEADVDVYTIKNGDDYEYAHRVADFLGFPVVDLDYDMADEKEVMQCFKFNETPIDLGSVVPNQIVFRNVGSDIILSGDGADELFGGYKRIDDYDSQLSDVFQELPYYHLPRLDRACSRFAKELRNPFLSRDIIPFALALPFEQRRRKKILKEIAYRHLPEDIVDRPKLPLKNPELVKDPMAYRKTIHNMFYNKIDWHEDL